MWWTSLYVNKQHNTICGGASLYINKQHNTICGGPHYS